MRVVLVWPYLVTQVPRMGGAVLPVGLMSLAAVLQAAGHEAIVVDLNASPEGTDAPHRQGIPTLDEMVAAVVRHQPDVVGISAIVSVAHDALVLAKAVKDACSATVVMGGPGLIHEPERLMAACPWVDLMAIGEGEGTILEIMEGVRTGDYAGRPGIVYRRQGEILRNPSAPLIDDLDSLPIPAFHLQRWRRTYWVEFSRGCPFGCAYCSTSRYWGRRYRAKSPERVGAEIEAILALGQGAERPAIHFVDDNLVFDRDKALGLCRVLRETGVRWCCTARADGLDEGLVSAMAEAGCDQVFIGLESASNRTLKEMRKGTSVECALKALGLLTAHGVHPRVSLMYGFPEESDDDLRETMHLVRDIYRIPGAGCDLFGLRCLGGTPLHEQMRDRLVMRPGDIGTARGVLGRYACLGEAEEDPGLFPHILTIEGSTFDRYPHLVVFATYLLPLLAGAWPGAWGYLMAAFNDDVFDFFLDFRSVMPQCFTDADWFRACADDPAGFRREMARWLAEYLRRRRSAGLSFQLAYASFLAGPRSDADGK